MVQNIFLLILGALALAAGVWSWKICNGGSIEEDNMSDEKEHKE